MDDADIAALHLETLEELRRRAIPKRGPDATGSCLFCDAPLKDGERWCDVECREDWTRLGSQ